MSEITIGHHGTSFDAAESIINGDFDLSQGDHHWLGNGVYFFKDNIDMAREWAFCDGHRKKYTKYGIIRSELHYTSDGILDLRKEEQQNRFHIMRDIHLKKIREKGIKVKGKQENYDGKIINDMCNMFNMNIAINRFFIHKKGDNLIKSFSRIPNCTVICVKSTDNIHNSTIIEKGETNG